MLKNNKKLPESQEWPKIRVWGYTARNQLDCTMGTSVRNLGPRPLNSAISAHCTHSPPVATFQSFARADSTCRICHCYLSLIISHHTAFFMALLSRLEPHGEFAESKSHIRVLLAKKDWKQEFLLLLCESKAMTRSAIQNPGQQGIKANTHMMNGPEDSLPESLEP